MYGAALTPPADLPALVHDIRSLLQRPSKPFGINLFVPPRELPPLTQRQQRALDEVHAYYGEKAKELGLACDVRAPPAPALSELHAKFEAQVEVSMRGTRRGGLQA